MTHPTAPTQEAVTAVWRRESVRLVAALARMTRDLDLAEDLAQDALVAALEQWPGRGVPVIPGAWLMAVAKRRGIDQFRATRSSMVSPASGPKARPWATARLTSTTGPGEALASAS